MGILSASTSITRYLVQGKPDPPIYESVSKSLKANAIPEIDESVAGKIIGWTSFETPYRADFEGSSFNFGPYFVFSLRIDRKVLSPKIIRKHIAIETEKRLKSSGRMFLSADEKKMIKDHVVNVLNLRIPSTPSIYDLIWDYHKEIVWFFTTLKSANEELETLFLKTFKLSLIRLFPYTLADVGLNLSAVEKDELSKLSPASFYRNG